MKKIAAIMLAGTLSIGTIGTSTVVFAENNTNIISKIAASQEESTDLLGLIIGLAGNLRSLDFSAILSALRYNYQTYSIDVDTLLKTLGITQDILVKVIDEAETIALNEARVDADEVKAFSDEIRKEIGEGTIKLDKLYGILNNDGKQILAKLLNDFMHGNV